MRPLCEGEQGVPAAASEALPRCPAGRSPSPRWGGLEGFTPPHRFKARIAASDGHNTSTRAARSAGLRFAVILLSKAMDVVRDHLIHRKRSPFPYEGKALMRRKVGWTSRIGRDTSQLRRAKRCRTARRGEAHRRAGWAGGVYPSAQIQGADSGFRRTQCLHPRRAKRRAQVCGDSTVQSDGQGNQQSLAPVLAPHPPLTRSPFPS